MILSSARAPIGATPFALSARYGNITTVSKLRCKLRSNMAAGGQRQPDRRRSKVGALHRQRSGLQDDPQQKATIAYIKRVLCSKPRTLDGSDIATEHDTEPLENILPPLTSSNAIDIELYALISVILSNFVQVWYNRITPDQDFVAEIVQIIAHCTRGVEQRLRQVDLESLLLDELPDLLLEHVHGMRP